MMKLGWQIAITVPLWIGLPNSMSWAQSIVPAADSTNTQVTFDGTDHTITGGATSADAQNLFHRFTEFNVLTGESATFLTDPAILNVFSGVSGATPSIIDGLLQVSGSNANLFLINPNGILLGPNAALNLQGSFNAVTADQVNFAAGVFGIAETSDYAALMGEPQSFGFSLSAPAAVVNAGELAVPTGESVVLVGGQVVNTGTIAAPGGNIIISAVDGQNLVRIEQAGSLLNLEVEALATVPPEATAGIAPVDLPELLTGSAITSVVGAIVNPDGSITLSDSDTSVPNAPGTTAVGGTLTTTSDHQGGHITVLGSTIGLLNAALDASGISGGGSVRIGGDYTGNGPLPTADVTFVDAASQVVADAIAQGSGGTVILWSEETTRSYGRLSARGGAIGGNGGLVETSSRGYLETQGVPDISAPQGQAGTWLLDPFDIEIVDDASTDLGAFPSGNPFVAEDGNPAIVSWFDIEDALNQGPGAVVTVSTGQFGNGNGDITVDNYTLSRVSPNTTLELRAAGDIEIPFGLTSPGGVSYDFRADTDSNGSGQIRISNALTTAGGNIFLSGADAGFAPAIQADGAINSNGGNITLQSSNSDIVLFRVNAANVNTGTGGDIFIQTPEFIRVTSNTVSLRTLGGAEIRLEHGGNGDLPFTVGDASLNGTNGSINNGVTTVPLGDYFSSVSFGNISILTTANDDFDCVSGCEDGSFTSDFAGDDFVADDPYFDDTGGDLGFEGEEFGDDSFGGSDEFFEDEFGDDDFFGEDEFGDWDDFAEFEDEFADDEFGEFEEDFGDEFADDEFAEDEFADDEFAEDEFAEFEDEFGAGSEQSPYGASEELTLEELAIADALYAEDFAAYFDLPVMPDPDFATSQDMLQTLTQQVGTSSALVYARFTPAGDTGIQGRSPKQLQNPQPTDVLQLVVVVPNGEPQQIMIPEATREQVVANVRRLQIELTDRTRRRLDNYLQYSQALYDWLVAPIENTLAANDIGHISMIMAPGLRSLPIAALHDGEQFIIEKYTVGLMPSLALTDTRYTDLRQDAVLAMGASEFSDQPNLPAVPFELSTIVEELRPGERTLNEFFTPETLVSLRQASGYRILHLATHGEFRSGGPDNSYIQFWDERLRLDQIRNLQLNNPPLELLVMSACRTALGDVSAELGFAGLAVQAGVKSALASLWQVSDLETAGLMTEFYTQLNQQPYKAEALRQAQLAMLRGEVTVQEGTLTWSGGSQPLPPELADLRFGNTQHPYYWSAFTLVGSPW